MASSQGESFARYEKKFLLSQEQYRRLSEQLEGHVCPDRYGSYPVCSGYYDTPDYRLIRASLEKPIYKEKLRVRYYGVPQASDPVFVEIKKKYRGIVYKRRTVMPAETAPAYLAGQLPTPETGQIQREIERFRDFYRPEPKLYLAYDREAMTGLTEPELRITFDRNIRWRTERPDLLAGSSGTPLLSDDTVLMELKVPAAVPLWLARLLSTNGIRPASFSKYGTCFREYLLPGFIQSVTEDFTHVSVHHSR